MQDSKEALRLAGCMQQPPEEEAAPLPPRPADPAYIFAARLYAAYRRARAFRSIRLLNEEDTRFKLRVVYDDPPDAVWLTLAKRVIAAGITDPERFIHAQFRLGAVTYPTKLCGPKAFKVYEEYGARAVGFLTEDWKSQTRIFECRIVEIAASYPHFSTSRNWDFVLRDSVTALSPLFRYCIAVSENFFETAALFKEESLQQFLTDPLGYRKAWGVALPESLVAEASAIIKTPL